MPASGGNRAAKNDRARIRPAAGTGKKTMSTPTTSGEQSTSSARTASGCAHESHIIAGTAIAAAATGRCWRTARARCSPPAWWPWPAVAPWPPACRPAARPRGPGGVVAAEHRRRQRRARPGCGPRCAAASHRLSTPGILSAKNSTASISPRPPAWAGCCRILQARRQRQAQPARQPVRRTAPRTVAASARWVHPSAAGDGDEVGSVQGVHHFHAGRRFSRNDCRRLPALRRWRGCRRCGARLAARSASTAPATSFTSCLQALTAAGPFGDQQLHDLVHPGVQRPGGTTSCAEPIALAAARAESARR